METLEKLRFLVAKAKSIWRYERSHIAADLKRLESYVFYGGLYGRSPELIKKRILLKDENAFKHDYLDEVFRKIAWQAVVQHPLSGVEDQNNNRVGNHIERCFKEWLFILSIL